jgi:hydrogenase-4 component B
MLMLAGLCLMLGLAPAACWPAITRAAESWHPGWTATGIPAPLLMLGMVHIALAVFLLAAGAGLWWKARANGLSRGPTWDCGYAAPAARMQYTSGSFAGIAAGWFRWILQPEHRLRRPRGNFPVVALSVERVPETVLERWIVPASGMVMWLSTAVRRLQHGRLRAYILYLLAGLLALGALVLLGGIR